MMTELASATVGPRGRVIHGTDAELAVQFYMRPVKDERESAKEGRPIFRDVPYVKIQIPGDKLSAWEGRVTEEHRMRFPRQWEMFEAGHRTEQIVGTPLKEWPALTASQVAQMNALGIYTVDQLAALSDTGLERLGMHARTLQKKARAFLEAATSTAPIEQLTAENERLKEEMAAMRKTQEETSAALLRANQLMEQMMASQKAAEEAAAVPPVPAKRGPGRPRKEALQ